MHGTLPVPRREQTKIDRRDLQDTEGNFVGDLARFLWPRRTAAEIAALADCSVRNVEFYLSGEQKWSGDAIAAIVAEILRRHSMRNVKVRARQGPSRFLILVACVPALHHREDQMTSLPNPFLQFAGCVEHIPASSAGSSSPQPSSGDATASFPRGFNPAAFYEAITARPA